MEKELVDLGLSRNEAKIYLFLLKNPNVTTGPIIKETRIANSRVYESLNSLISKGLVNYNVQKDGKYFSAAEPKKIIENEEERMKKIKAILPQLNGLIGEEKKNTTTAVYEGFEGFKTAFKKIIDDCPVGGTIDIIGFSEPKKASDSLKLFLSNINLKCAQKKQKLRFILDRETKDWQGKDRESVKTNEVRYMPKGYISPAAIDIFGDYVYMFLWEEKPFVFMIKNKMIAESFKVYFNFLWRMAK